MGLWDSISASLRSTGQYVSNGLKSIRDMGRDVHETGHDILRTVKGFLDSASPWLSPLPYVGDAVRFAQGATDIVGGVLDAGRIVSETLGGLGEYLGDI